MLRRFAPLALAAPLGACATPQTSPPEPFEVIVREYAEATEVAKVLGRAFAGPDGPSARVIADERTNSLIILGDPEEIPRVKGLIVVLDREVR